MVESAPDLHLLPSNPLQSKVHEERNQQPRGTPESFIAQRRNGWTVSDLAGSVVRVYLASRFPDDEVAAWQGMIRGADQSAILLKVTHAAAGSSVHRGGWSSCSGTRVIPWQQIDSIEIVPEAELTEEEEYR